MKPIYRNTLFLLFLFLLPWQTRWIVHDVSIGGALTEYGRLSVYVIDVVLIGYLALAIAAWKKGTLKRALKRPIFRTIALAGVALSVWAYLSILWAPSPLVALFGAMHLDLAIGFLLVALLDKQAGVGRMVVVLILGMMVPSGLAWWQAAVQSVDASTLFGMAVQNPNVLGTAVIEHANGRWLRAYGSFPHPNILGGFVAFALLLTFQMLATKLTKREQGLYWIASVVLSGALVLSASRSAWLAFALGFALWFFGILWMRDVARLYRTLFPMFICAVSVLILGLSLYPILSARFDTTNRLEARSISERAASVEDSAFLLRSPYALLAGVGMHGYVFNAAARRPFLEAYVYQPIHNVPLLILAELGLVGLALVIVLVVATDWRVHVYWRRPSSLMAMSLGVVVLVIALFDHYAWTQVSGMYLLATFFVLNTKLGQLSEQADKNIGVRP